jgi:hypothetical protein
MPVNVELLERTLTYIRDHPEEWDQGHWICNTTACFAGHAILLDGVEITNRLPSNWGMYSTRSGEIDVSVSAEQRLGLTRQQANTLFWCKNRLDDLERIAKDIINEAQDERVASWGTTPPDEAA